jgi:peptidylprolyl isomerase
MSKRYMVIIACTVFGGAVAVLYKTTYDNGNKETTTIQPAKPKGKSMQKTDSGILYEIITEAPEGAATPKAGQVVTAHYTGWINDGGQPGEKFDSSVDRGQPFQFVVGVGQVIKGWDETMLNMKVGEKRRVILPSELAYGERGAGAIIKPNSDLMFDIEVLAAE